jgi:poly(3-hydroxybutyrate) depolymerase
MRSTLPLLLLGLSCATPRPPSDCGSESADTCRVEHLTVGSEDRTYVVSNKYPPNCAAGRVPLIVFFHGSNTNGIEARTDYAYFEDAIGARARMVYPDGLGRPELSGGSGWNRDPAGNDVAFVDALVTALTADSCIDSARVLAVGHSRGGRFTEVLACNRASTFKGFAEASAGTDNVSSCPDQAPIWIAHGKDDQQVPYADGVAMRDRWMKRNGCTALTSEPAANTCADLSCPAATPVRWCPYEGETWSGHFPPPFFGTSVWDFFSRL